MQPDDPTINESAIEFAQFMDHATGNLILQAVYVEPGTGLAYGLRAAVSRETTQESGLRAVIAVRALFYRDCLAGKMRPLTHGFTYTAYTEDELKFDAVPALNAALVSAEQRGGHKPGCICWSCEP